MNKSHAVAETANDEQLLDQLVQDLFLAHLRRELDIQKESIEENKNMLFNFNRSLAKENGKLLASLETMTDTLDAQTHELVGVKDDARTHYCTLLNSVKQSRTDAAALHETFVQLLAAGQEQCNQEQKAQSEQLRRTQEHIIQISADMQEKNVILATLTEQSVALSQLLVKQDETLIQQLVAMREGLFAEIDNNRRWGRWGVGLTLVNTLALVGLIVLFKIL
ncbi:hypothetical protein [Aeromonas allosaccharophila]|uniref:hypothetical protein n=1 Tax=Aeromonas allosaccharophila TaxID=656 RepID=UPI003D1E474D